MMTFVSTLTRKNFMTITLRPFQQKLEQDVYQAWGEGDRFVMPVAATGSGKTVLFSKFLRDATGHRIALAHRQELVSQMSVTLGRNEVRHNIIAPENVRRMIVSMQIAELGTSYYDPNAQCHCAGVDTLIRLPPQSWDSQCTLQVQDEAHHVLRDNKWGKAAARYPNAYGLFPTATPVRADGMGLGRHADGLIDRLILAPGMRDIIRMGYLTDYRIICAESDIQMTDDDISDSTGDFNQTKLRQKHKESRKIVGDVVREYLTHARGKLGVTFAVDVEEATKIAQAFRDAGVPAEVVSAKTPDHLRADLVRKFKRRELLQLVNVDLFGEGFDLPALEVVSMARHTASFALYSQQFGRALRLMLDPAWLKDWASYDDATRRYFISISSKPRAIIIDHVGNVARHFGPPDALWRADKWTLDRREKRASRPSDAEPIRVCLEPTCLAPYSRVLKCCPHCGHYPVPAERSGPVFVDGDLTELSDEALAALRGEIAENVGDAAPYHPDPMIQASLRKRHWEKQQQMHKLRNAVAWWAGLQQAQGRSDSESYRLFYFKFGVDVATMQTYDRAQAEGLYLRVHAELAKSGIDADLDAGILFKH